MNKSINIIFAVIVIIGLGVASGALYTVDETQQVVITQFGEPMGKSITEAGLYFKAPFIQTVNYFEKRILQWDGDPNEITTRDKRYIFVDTTARWRIKDALKFMQSVRDENGAQARLDDIIDGATRDVISANIMIELVRNSNRLADLYKKGELKAGDFDIAETSLEQISVGREKLSREILSRAGKTVPNYGIVLVDVRFKHLNYIQEVQNKVFERMISERRKAAEQFRSEGQGKKAEIEGQIEKELKEIQSGAYRKAQEIKGKADAEAIKIYADAYNKDPEFYSFINTLKSYKGTINKDTTLILSTDNEFYSQLKGTN